MEKQPFTYVVAVFVGCSLYKACYSTVTETRCSIIGVSVYVMLMVMDADDIIRKNLPHWGLLLEINFALIVYCNGKNDLWVYRLILNHCPEKAMQQSIRSFRKFDQTKHYLTIRAVQSTVKYIKLLAVC